jgi:hypothetical protein
MDICGTRDGRANKPAAAMATAIGPANKSVCMPAPCLSQALFHPEADMAGRHP